MREKLRPLELPSKERLEQEADVGMAIESAEQEMQEILADIRLAKMNKAQWEMDIEQDLQNEMAALALLEEIDPEDGERASEIQVSGKGFRDMLSESIERLDGLITRLQSKHEHAGERREKLIRARRALIQAWDALEREQPQ